MQEIVERILLPGRIGFEITDELDSSIAVHDDIVSKMPGIVVMDSSRLATSNEGLITALQTSIPGAPIVVVEMEADEETFLKAVREGVMGYVLKKRFCS